MSVVEKSMLFLFKYNADLNTTEVYCLTHLILQKLLVTFQYVIRIVAEKSKHRVRCVQLCDVFDLDHLTSVRRWWRLFNKWQHDIVEFGRHDLFLLILIYVQEHFDRLEDPCLFQS